MNKFAERLRYLREEKELTYKELAKRLEVSERLVYYWANGNRECSFDMLLKLAEIFEVSTDFLLGKTDY